MKRLHRPGRLVWAVVAVAVVVVAAGCGSSGSSGSSGGSSPELAAPQITIGLVTDIGGLNDRSFNHLAFMGLQNAESQLGIKGDVLQSTYSSDYIPNLQTAAAHGDKLVIAVGFLMESAVEKVAKAFPNTDFAIIDSGPTKPIPNLKSLLFHEQDGGYMAGYLAGPRDEDERRLDRRRAEDPAGRPLHRRLPGRREGRQPQGDDAERATRRASPTRRPARSSR